MESVAVSLATYTAAATVLTITPGLDTALVLRPAATRSARRAGLAALGVVTGCCCWTIVVSVGLGAVLAASHAAYSIVRWVGAGYLVWLGVQVVRDPRRTFVGGNAGM